MSAFKSIKPPLKIVAIDGVFVGFGTTKTGGGLVPIVPMSQADSFVQKMKLPQKRP